ncbi:SCO4983 family protein [Peterkaempfera bronchialis]|uniref:Uncharacterized protein n=1 Tax=Peterkaempfera bronchialis TaxID=2126346 RepID=A0A345SZR9_9ACTN|nr:hypothetical protein [Peterkaempfera bronchialis]AXI79224.1 hypothetical protein C7M71_019205 [Peterkaempfera bronchialis]
MYEPIRHKSVHTMRESAPMAAAARPRTAHHNSSDHTGVPADRPAHLRQQLAGHLDALLSATAELRRATAAALDAAPAPDPALGGQRADLESAAQRIGDRIAELSPAGEPLRVRHLPDSAAAGSLAELHARAHTLAGRVLVVAAAQQDTATAMLACTRMDAHEAACRALRAA